MPPAARPASACLEATPAGSPGGEPDASGRGRRLGARPPSSDFSGARIPQGSGPFCFFRQSISGSRPPGREEARPWRACACKSAQRSFKTGCKARSGAGWMLALPLHFGCAHALRHRKTSRCARCRDVRGPEPAHVQRDTASDGMTRAWTQPKWRSNNNVVFVQQAKDAGLSSRQRGFESRTRRHQQRSSRADAPRGLQTGRNDWAAPEPVTGWNSLGV